MVWKVPEDPIHILWNRAIFVYTMYKQTRNNQRIKRAPFKQYGICCAAHFCVAQSCIEINRRFSHRRCALKIYLNSYFYPSSTPSWSGGHHLSSGVARIYLSGVPLGFWSGGLGTLPGKCKNIHFKTGAL